MASYTLESVLDEKIDYSSYSAEESFTLSDILAEKDVVEEDLLKEEEIIEEGMFDDFEEEELEEKEETTDVNLSPTNEEEPKKGAQQRNLVIEERQLETKQLQESKKDESAGQLFAKINERLKAVDRCKRIQSLPVPPLPEIKNITFTVLNNVTAAFDQTAKGVGIPTVITTNSVKYLAVGTSFGNVVLFKVGDKGKNVLGNADNRRYGAITSIAISREGRYLVSGQENGLITIWDLGTMSELKKQLATQTKIIKIIFCSETQFLLADLEGNVLMFTIQHYFWVKIKRDRLFEKSSSIFYDMKIHSLQSGISVIVLCSLEQILIASYLPKVQAIDKLGPPDQFLEKKVPNIELGKTAIMSIQNPNNKLFHFNDVLCVSWSHLILVYKFKEGIRLEKLELVYRFSQETPIYNLEFISEGVLVTLDSKDTFRSFRLWINDSGGHQLLNEKFIPEEVIYQRYLRDSSNRYIKVFNNTLVSCSFNPKQKQLFFICKNSIYRCRVYKWNQFVSDLLITENKLQESLKICIQIYYNRMNIFLEPVVINQKTMKIFCEVGRVFMKKKLEYIEALQADRAVNFERKEDIKNVVDQIEEIYDCIIEYMLQIRCPNQLFEMIYLGIVKQKFQDFDEYHHKFLDCLEPFILEGRLISLPSRTVFEELIDYFLPQNKRELIDSFIMFLNVETLSMFYEEAITICSQNKLYKALTYVCSTHQDFISPLTRLLNEIRTAQASMMESAQEAYYTMLKDYIIKLLGGCYINGISFSDQFAVMKKSLANWLMCRQTFMFFARNEQESYRLDYFHFIEQLVYLLSGEAQLEAYIHSELKNLTAQQFRGKNVAELFIKISDIITLDLQEIKLVVAYSDPELIQKHLSKYLHFYRTYRKELSQVDDLDKFYQQNQQLHYFHQFIKANEQDEKERVLPNINLLERSDEELNAQLTKYILNKMTIDEVLWNLQHLLKIHSENTMIFTLERFPLETVNERLLSINDTCYRYLVVRKILKLLRKPGKREKIKKFPSKKTDSFGSSSRIGNGSVTGSKLSVNRSKLLVSRQSDLSDLIQLQELQRSNSDRKRLSKEIMQFYIECLCKYKNEKRVYYELVCNLNDYYDIIDELVGVIKQYDFNSCLGLLEQARKNYQQAYEYFIKVYRHFFFEENYKKLINFRQCHGRFMRRIFERMLAITSVMNNDQQWMEILKCIITPLEEKGIIRTYVCDDIQDVYTKVGKTQPFLRQLGEIIEQCLINVSTKIPIEAISTYIGQHPYVFSRMFVLESFRTTLLTYSNNANILSATNEMIINNGVSTFEDIYQLLIKGIAPETKCLKCNGLFDDQHPLKVYTCGHTFHTHCPDENKRLSPSNYRYESEKQQEDDLVKNDQANGAESEDKCQYCQYLRTKGNIEISKVEIQDFHKEYEENILVKGVVGIVTIIPNMISAIPGSITALSSLMSPEEEMLARPISQPEDKQALDDQMLSYLAFTENLQGIRRQNYTFIEQCSKYFEEGGF